MTEQKEGWAERRRERKRLKRERKGDSPEKLEAMRAALDALQCYRVEGNDTVISVRKYS